MYTHIIGVCMYILKRCRYLKLAEGFWNLGRTWACWDLRLPLLGLGCASGVRPIFEIQWHGAADFQAFNLCHSFS